ncbi:ABC transporter ATP-binding protein [Lacinutrix undariae]
MGVILKAENISKQYRLGVVGTGTISHDLNRWWASLRGKEDPYLKVGAVNDRSTKAESDYVWALKAINFEVQQGEVLGIIGKNGAGKSTLLKILSRVTIPTTGEIKTKGRIASLLEVGTGFHPELTGRENMYLNGAILGMTKAEIKAKEQEIIEFSGCERYVDTPTKRYSSGMRVRLAFAVAAFLEPDILVVDEVLAVGDAEFQKKAIGKMQDISKGDGRTVLFVSHNMAAVKNLCTRAIVLEHGVSVYEGGTDEAVDFYLSQNKKGEVANTLFPISCNDLELDLVTIFDEKESKVSTLILGANYFISVKLSNGLNEKKINIRLQVYDQDESLITTLNTFHTNDSYDLKRNESITALCFLEKLSIAPGEYFLGVEILDLNERKLLFTSDHLLQFFIEAGDYYGSGKIPSFKNMGKIISEYTWKIS